MVNRESANTVNRESLQRESVQKQRRETSTFEDL